MNKPYSESCLRNAQVILEVLQKYVSKEDKSLFEIGSGTGQHAIYMAPKLKQLVWHTSDSLEKHEGINLWIKDSSIKNISKPVEYLAGRTQLPQLNAQIFYTANTLHIMPLKEVLCLIKDLGTNLLPLSKLLIYGPFKYNGCFTSHSNAEFDDWLKQNNQDSGIRNFEDIVKEFEKYRVDLIDDIKMPANNRMLVFLKNLK